MALQGWVDSVKGFKAACLHHKRERKWYFFFMDFHFILPLISLLPWLFSYLQGEKKTKKKNQPWDQLYLPHFSSGLLSFCHLQTSMSSTMCRIHGASLAFWTERDPFLLLLAPIQGFLLPFKWAVDEVSLIRLSQLTLVSAVCFPSKGVLTSPILFLYPPLCTFHPGFHPKKPFQRRSQWTPL